MGKIKITESELKQVIHESVSEVLNERVNYGSEWETLSEPEKKAAAEKYYKNSIFHPSMGSVTYTYPDGTTGTSAYKYDQATGQQLRGTANYNMDAAKDIYNRKRGRKQRNGNLTYSADQFNQAQKNSEGQINTLKAQLSQAQNLNNGYKSAISQISSAISQTSKAIGGQIAEAVGVPASFDSSFVGAPTANTPTTDQQAAMAVKSAVPNLDQILKSINDMKTKVTQLTKANQQLTSVNKNLTSQNQNLAKRIQNGQSQRIASPIAAPKATAQATTQKTGLARPGAAAPGNARA
jgi:regulator of replication initiation timing